MLEQSLKRRKNEGGHGIGKKPTATALKDDVSEETRRDSSSCAAATAVAKGGRAESTGAIPAGAGGTAWPASVIAACTKTGAAAAEKDAP